MLKLISIDLQKREKVVIMAKFRYYGRPRRNGNTNILVNKFLEGHIFWQL